MDRLDLSLQTDAQTPGCGHCMGGAGKSVAVGVKLSPSHKTFFCQQPDYPIELHDVCIVPDPQNGLPVPAYVVCFEGRSALQYERLGRVVRSANEQETNRLHESIQRERQALEQARQKVLDHNLPMKLISVRFEENPEVVHFDFTADHRVDFRHLVRDLAGLFKARIELWQIGPREGTAEKDGYGLCGQRLCCAAWIKEFPSVSVRQARDQDIHHAPPQLTGQCSRLRCCLRYEHECYCELGEGAPSLGALVRDDQGREGNVCDRNLLTRLALVRMSKSQSEWLKFDQLTVLKQTPKSEPSPEELAQEDALSN